MNPGFWLTAKRIRIHGLLLGVCLWTVYAVNMSAPGLLDRNGLVKGTDFLHFYTLGNLARQGRGDLLYDMRAQAELTRQLLPQAPDSLYVPLYGPQVSLFFAPFARLPYGWALAAWLSANVLIFAFCCYAVWRTLSCSSRKSLDDSGPGNCLSGILPLAGLGTDFRYRASVLHPGLFGAATGSKDIGGIGHWIVDLQAAVGVGRGSCICMRA